MRWIQPRLLRSAALRCPDVYKRQRMFLGDGLLLNDGNQETIYISMVAKIFPVFIAGIFLSAILAAIMSTEMCIRDRHCARDR